MMFEDALRGWLATVEPGRPGEESYSSPSRITVYRTSDGGNSWESTMFEGPPVGDPGPPSLGLMRFYFLDEQRGWLAAEHRGGLQGRGIVFETADGGATWRELPGWTYCCAGPIYFDDETHGWLASPAELMVTHDGGNSWQPQALPLPDGYDRAASLDHAPVFVSSRGGVVPVSLAATNEATGATGFYLTHDAGDSWQLAGTLASPASMVSVVDLDVWFAVGEEFHSTRDGGKTWETVRPDWKQAGRLVRLPGAATSIDPIEIEFITERDGWAILQVTTGTGEGVHALIQTEDGGRTWRLIGPYEVGP
ncbi:MAG: hypothetical protein WD379_03270 [Dehalococcoidia bacterium]